MVVSLEQAAEMQSFGEALSRIQGANPTSNDTLLGVLFQLGNINDDELCRYAQKMEAYVQADEVMVWGSNQRDALKNCFDIKKHDQLQCVENRIVAARAARVLNQAKQTDTYDADWFKEIHRQLFTGIYAWAGEYREYQTFREPTAPFVFPVEDRLINQAFHRFKYRQEQANLSKSLEGDLKDITLRDIALAELWADLNYIHPFLEGNGRATQLALTAFMENELNVTMDWANVTQQQEYAAAQAATNADPAERLLIPYARLLAERTIKISNVREIDEPWAGRSVTE